MSKRLDIDECKLGRHNCDLDAMCHNKIGSYNCTCNSGYEGDGINCNDIDECKRDIHQCEVNARCVNTIGGYNCTCNLGFVGDGYSCSGIVI